MSEDSAIFQQRRQPIPTPRGPFVPPWYAPHEDTTLRVRGADGTVMPFTIGDVAPERRWAIRDDGTVMDKETFLPLFDEWVIGQQAWQIPPGKAVNTEFNAVPSPVGFVAKQVDPAKPHRLLELPMPMVARERTAGPTNLIDKVVSQPGSGWAPAPAKEE